MAEIALKDNTLGTALHVARTNQRFTQETLSLAVGVSKGTISNWERNEGSPPVQIFMKMVEVLEAEWLLQHLIDGFRIGNFLRHLASVPSVTGQLELTFDPPATLSVV